MSSFLVRFAQKLLKLGERILGPLAERVGIRVLNVAIGRFGETALALEIFVKMGKLGWRPRYRAVLIAPPGRVVNADLLARWKRHVRIWSSPAVARVLEHAVFSGRLVYTPPGPRGDEPLWEREFARVAVDAEWERQGRGPLLRLSREDEARGRAALAGFGMPEGAWFVSLHVREAGFLNETTASHRQHRNADIRTYLPAIEAIVERGGWVVRVGDPTMTPLPPLERVVDYPHHELREEWLDVYLAAACRFVLGTSSGVISVSTCFDTPIAAANWQPLSTVPPGRDVYVPKLYRSVADDHILSFAEMLSPELFLCRHWQSFEELGVAVVDNTPDEIRALTIEMLDRLDGTVRYSAEDELRQERFRALLPHLAGDIRCRVGRDFLRKHADLLPPA